jgi:hypothetical protein
MYTLEQLEQKNIKQLKEIGHQLNVFPEADRRCRQNWIDAIAGVNPPLLALLEVSLAAPVDRVSEAIEVQAQEPPIESKFGRIVYPGSAQKLIAQVVETLSSASVDRVSEPIASAAENSPGVKTEATAIGSAAKNPILTGITLSDRFCACYAPPQAQIIRFQSDADGQLSLLNFEIELVDEPPDPDDFQSLDAFREALACWDWEHNEVSPQHNEVSPQHNDPLQVSLDSFCLWGLCPADWYELVALLEPSSMLELSHTCKSSITSDFFIPTFDCLSDRPNRSDEPPDTGIFAKLSKPNSPSFPPATVGQARAKSSLNAVQTHTKLIPSAGQTHTSCILAGSSTQPARSPPSGDAGF